MENIIRKKNSKEYNFIIKPPNNKFIFLLLVSGLAYIYNKKDN